MDSRNGDSKNRLRICKANRHRPDLENRASELCDEMAFEHRKSFSRLVVFSLGR